MTDVAADTHEGRSRGADPRARVPYALFVPAAIGVLFPAGRAFVCASRPHARRKDDRSDKRYDFGCLGTTE